MKHVTLALLVAAVLQAAELRPVGVLGNSGVSGDTLVRVGAGHGPGGVYLDADLGLWLNGGDCVNHTDFSGRVIRRYPLAPACGGIASRAFAATGGALCFFGITPQRRPETALYRLPMTDDGEVTLLRLFPDIAPHVGGVLAAQTCGGKLLAGLPDGEGRWQVGALDPATGEPTPLFTVNAKGIGGLALDPATGRLYCGGSWGKHVAARRHHPNVSEIVRLAPDGTEELRIDCFGMEAIPSEFRGHISVAAGAVWDTAWYGFLGRYDLDLRPTPGRLTGWLLQVGYPCQLLDSRALVELPPADDAADLLAMSTYSPADSYLVTWDRRHERFSLARRIGCLPTVHSVALNANGLVAVGADNVQHWWRWDDAPDTPPLASSIGAAMTGGYFVDEGLVAMVLPRYRRGKEAPPVTAGLFYPNTARDATVNRHGEILPFTAVTGFTLVGDPDDRAARAYATDGDGECLWRTVVNSSGPHSRPNPDRWTRLDCDVPLPTPRDPAALADGSLAVATAGAVVCLAPGEAGLTQRWRVTTANDTPLGANLRLAAAGTDVVVADSDHHRVLWLAADGSCRAQFGDSDVPGDDAFHVNCPTAITVNGDRVLVYDAFNQRLLKLRIYR